jgi:hypothetical protein
MRHAHPSTTQRYLGKVTSVEAMSWKVSYPGVSLGLPSA